MKLIDFLIKNKDRFPAHIPIYEIIVYCEFAADISNPDYPMVMVSASDWFNATYPNNDNPDMAADICQKLIAMSPFLGVRMINFLHIGAFFHWDENVRCDDLELAKYWMAHGWDPYKPFNPDGNNPLENLLGQTIRSLGDYCGNIEMYKLLRHTAIQKVLTEIKMKAKNRSVNINLVVIN